MTRRSGLRLLLMLVTVVAMVVVLRALYQRAGAGIFHPDIAAGMLFLYVSAVIAIVLSAAASVREPARLSFHVVLALLTAAFAVWWFSTVSFEGSTTAGIFALASIAITLLADAVSEAPSEAGEVRPDTQEIAWTSITGAAADESSATPSEPTGWPAPRRDRSA